MKGSYLSLVSWRRRIVDRTMQPAGSDRWGGKLSGPALSLPRNDLPQEIEQPGEALPGDVQALPELAVGGGAAGLPVLLSVLPPEVVPERPELAPGARIRLQALDGGRDAARHLLEALPGDAVAALPLREKRRPAPPRVSLQRVQEVFETKGLDALSGQLEEELPQPPGDRGLQQLEDPEPERIVLPLPLVQEVPDVE